jgi:hypothetical protein
MSAVIGEVGRVQRQRWAWGLVAVIVGVGPVLVAGAGATTAAATTPGHATAGVSGPAGPAASAGPAGPVGHVGPAGPVGHVGPAQGVTEGPDLALGGHQFTSRNWDGYAVYPSLVTTRFNEVTATWKEPAVTCEAADAWAVFWIGLDGLADGTVEQGGSEAYCATKGGTPQYDAWWEMYPAVPVQTSFAIAAGDTIVAHVTFDKATARYTIGVHDVTSGHSLTEVEACETGVVCGRSSAEVIAEDVEHFGSGGYFPLADYGTLGFTGIGVTDAKGDAGTLSSNAWQHGAIAESAAGVSYASVSPLSDGGRAFDATWHHQ